MNEREVISLCMKSLKMQALGSIKLEEFKHLLKENVKKVKRLEKIRDE